VVIGKITTDKTHRAVTRRQLSFLCVLLESYSVEAAIASCVSKPRSLIVPALYVDSLLP